MAAPRSHTTTNESFHQSFSKMLPPANSPGLATTFFFSLLAADKVGNTIAVDDDEGSRDARKRQLTVPATRQLIPSAANYDRDPPR